MEVNFNSRRRPLGWAVPGAAMIWLIAANLGWAGALETYVQSPDASYNWKRTEQKKFTGGTLTHIELVSQTWRRLFWSHHLQIVRPDNIRNADIAFLYI